MVKGLQQSQAHTLRERNLKLWIPGNMKNNSNWSWEILIRSVKGLVEIPEQTRQVYVFLRRREPASPSQPQTALVAAAPQGVVSTVSLGFAEV